MDGLREMRVRIREQGQIPLPAEAWGALCLTAGDSVTLLIVAPGVVLIAKDAATAHGNHSVNHASAAGATDPWGSVDDRAITARIAEMTDRMMARAGMRGPR